MSVSKIRPSGLNLLTMGCAFLASSAFLIIIFPTVFQPAESKPERPRQPILATSYATTLPLLTQETNLPLEEIEPPMERGFAPTEENLPLEPPGEQHFLSPSTLEELQRNSIATADSDSLKFTWPVTGYLSSRFGYRWGRLHEGIDIAVPIGRQVRAAAPGVVTLVGWHGGYGYAVTIRHPGGWSTLYAHNSRLLVTEGQRVEGGEVISLVGNSGNSTGPHLHFEIHINGRSVNPLSYLSR